MSTEVSRRDSQRVVTVSDSGSVLGWIVIDTEVGGRARGGIRLVPDATVDELSEAARAMTLKCGFLGLPHGGAKAGVIGDADAGVEEKRRLLAAFARAAAPVLRSREYIPDADLGTDSGLVAGMLAAIGVKVRPRERAAGLSGNYTAASCIAAAVVALGRRGVSVEGVRAAIEGFGSVGAPLAKYLDRRGAKVVAVSTSSGALFDDRGLDVAELLACSRRFGSAFPARYAEGRPGAQLLERSALLELPVELLCPCARLHSVNESNAGRIQADIVCPGANNPLTAAAEACLESRGAVVVPDFVANCGGVLGGTLEFAGVKAERIATLVERQVAPMAESLLNRAADAGMSPRELAVSEALARHDRARGAAESPGVVGRVVAAGLELYRRGWVPASLVAPLAPRYLASLAAR